MSPRSIALASLAALLLGLGATGRSTWRLRALDAEAAGLAEQSRRAGDTFVETLQGEHATRQFQALDRRRAVVVARAEARRDRLLGLLLVAAGALGLGAASAFRRMAREIAEGRQPID